MRIKTAWLMVFCVLLIGCATTNTRVGSQAWYDARTAEIEEALKNNEIDKGTYLQLKNEADEVRAQYLSSRNTHSHIGIGSRGGHVGVGVGF